MKARCSSDGDEARLANVCAVNYGGGGKRGGGLKGSEQRTGGGMKRNVNIGIIRIGRKKERRGKQEERTWRMANATSLPRKVMNPRTCKREKNEENVKRKQTVISEVTRSAQYIRPGKQVRRGELARRHVNNDMCAGARAPPRIYCIVVYYLNRRRSCNN